LLVFVVLLVVLGLLWLVKYLPERTVLVHPSSMTSQGPATAGAIGRGRMSGDPVPAAARGKTAADIEINLLRS
jgi:hypothetical protein